MNDNIERTPQYLPQINVGDLVEIGIQDERLFGYFMRVEEVVDDLYTGTLLIPDGERISLHRNEIVGAFREIDLN